MTVKEVLVRARGELVRRGWYQGWFFDRQGGAYITEPSDRCRVCAWGAINVAATGHPHPLDATSDLSDLANAAVGLFEGINGFAEQISEWNDHSNRTFDEVLTAFDTAIEACHE